MANPLISGSYKQRKGQQTPPDRPDRVEPVEEHVKGVVFPYRGMEQHGVPQSASVNPEDYYDEEMVEDRPDEYLPEQEEEVPVPVRIVQATSRERLEWRVSRFLVSENCQEILGRHEKRRHARIRVHGSSDPIYISPDNGVKPLTGYLIPAGTEFGPISSTENIYACADPTKTVEISIFYEFGVEL